MNQPRLLKNTAGSRNCSIFRIPESLRDINPQAYRPHVVSIGPYHHGKKELKMMEEHKWRFLNSLLARCEKASELGLDDFLKAMAKMEEAARESYSEDISMESAKFVEMLLLDGCFIVELLRRHEEDVEMEVQYDPLLFIPWVIPYLTRDLLRLENQLPLFVLQRLFDLSNVPNGNNQSPLPVLALNFFKWGIDKPDYHIGLSGGRRYNHLLDLLRATFIPPHLKEPEVDNKSAKMLPCVSKLLRAGIKFKPSEEHKSLLEVSFENGVMRIPTLKIDDSISSFFQNTIAYEQSHPHCLKYFTTYATFMDCLIDDDKDVALMGDEKIIDNYFGTDNEVAKFFNQLGREVVFDIESCYLAKQFEEVNKYYRNSLHVRLAEFKSTYFNTPWSAISALAALILLLLTVTQTIFTIYPYFNPR